MRGYVVSKLAALAALVMGFCLFGVSACSSGQESVTPTHPSPEVTAQPSDASPSGQPTITQAPPRNDLARLPLRRNLKAGQLTVKVEYDTTLSIQNWSSGVNKPLQVSLTVVNKRKPGQKVYLTKATVYITGFDERGPVNTPLTLSDSAAIDPGFFVTFPSTYNQNFALPATDYTVQRLTVDFTYELLIRVGKDRDGRSYAKQVATDSLAVPIAS